MNTQKLNFIGHKHNTKFNETTKNQAYTHLTQKIKKNKDGG